MPGDFLLHDTVIAQCMLCPGCVCVFPSEVLSTWHHILSCNHSCL